MKIIARILRHFIGLALAWLVVFVGMGEAQAQEGSLSQFNLAYQYATKVELSQQWMFARHPTQPKGTYFVEWKSPTGQFDRFTFSYQWVGGYDTPLSPEFAPFPQDSMTIHWEEGRVIWEWEVNYPEDAPIMVVRAIHELSGNVYLFDMPAQHPGDFPGSDLVLREQTTDLPLFRRWVNVGDRVYPTSLYHPGDSIAYLYTYETDFDAALPPMATRSVNPGRTMEITSMQKVPLGEVLELGEQSLYLMQMDTNTLVGIGFWYYEQAYPKYNQAVTLLPPTTYISSRREQASILEAPDVKTALDEFWLGAALQVPNRARLAIRNYYRGITVVNERFGDYKAGWKTDMGMIMALFGPPTVVTRTLDEERWIYQQANGQRITFVFAKIKNIFTRQHYALRRQSVYNDIWLDQVDLWRKGLIEW